MFAFDIETGSLPEDVVLAQFDPKKVKLGNMKTPEEYGEFDPGTVKTGKITDPQKIEAKIEEARLKHEEKVAEAQQKVEEKIAEARQKHLDKAALSPATGCVLAVGWKNIGNANELPSIIGEGLAPPKGIDSPLLPHEAEVLKKFWSAANRAAQEGIKLVGFNIFNFDIPFLIGRSWVNDVEVPDFVIDNRDYPSSQFFTDLLVKYQCGNRQRTITQNGLAKMLGVGSKTEGMNGGDCARLWLGTLKEHKQAAAYAINDVELIAGCANKMQIF